MSFWNKKIFGGNDVFGLDLSDLSVKVAQIEKNGSLEEVVSFASLPITSGIISDGEIKNKQQVAEIIKRVLQGARPRKIKTNKVICSLPETKAFLRIISMPEMKTEEVREAVKWEIEATIPLPIDQIYYDWQVLEKSFGTEKGKINLLVVAVGKNTVDQTMEVLALAGLEVVGLEIESVAQSRSLLDEKKEKESVLLVDVGDRRTSFVIADAGIPCFTSSIPLSGTSLTNAIAKNLGVSFEEAENIKIQYGIGSDFKNDAIFKAVEPVLENLASEIERSIDFYVSSLQYSVGVDKIMMCGGGSNTKGLLPYLAKRLKRGVELGNPWVNMKLDKNLPIIEKSVASQYATVIGLALKGAHYEDLP